MLGTAFPADRILLIEQPGPWGRAGLRESQFDPVIAAALEQRLGRLGIRVLAIRRPGRAADVDRRRWGFADCRVGQERLIWGLFDEDADLRDLDPQNPGTRHGPGIDSAQPAYLICAHSKHDPCCAIRGRPVAAAFAQCRAEQSWETTHVGGERFAANVLVLPFGLLYGRILPFSVPAFADASERGEVIAPLLRGRVGLPSPVQAALAFTHEQFGLADRRDVTVLGSRQDAAHEASVSLRIPAGRIEVTIGIERSAEGQLTCSAHEPRTFLIYRPVAVTDPV